MREIVHNTARNVMVFVTDASDHITGLTGATLTITASKNGGAFASITPTVTERGNGWYSVALTTTHTNTLGDLALRATATGADPVDVVMDVVAAPLTAAGVWNHNIVTFPFPMTAAEIIVNTANTVSTFLDRLGMWTGSGVNTVLGAFRALMRKDAGVSVPSDISSGGASTYDHTTDSLEAIRDRGDEAWVGVTPPQGANVVTITVNDGTNPLENARVRVSQGAESYVALTDENGEATFALDDATWTVRVTKPGYLLAPQSLVVTGDTAETYSMEAVSIPLSSDPAQVTGYYFVYDENGQPEPGATVFIQMRTIPPGSGIAYDHRVREGTADSAGLVAFPGLFKGATYNTWRNVDGKVKAVTTTIPSTATDPFPLNSILGDT